jgi:carboxypeptidase PM20D1
MLARVTAAVGKEGKVDVLLQSEPTPPSPATGELFDTIARAMRGDAPGSVVAPIVGAGTTDSRYFRARGIVAYGIAPFKVNYYDAGGVHGVDERIRSRFFADGTRLMTKIVREFVEER